MAEQFMAIIEPRLERMNEAVAGEVAETIRLRMIDNTKSGKGFYNDTYIDFYNPQYAKKNKKAIRPVTLRNGRNTIEKYQTETTKTGATIQLIGQTTGGKKPKDMAVIFNYHDKGTATGGKMRSIFPKSHKSVPADIYDDAKQAINEVLSGKK